MKACIIKIGAFLPVGGIEEYCRMLQCEGKKADINFDICCVDIGGTRKKIKECELMNGAKYKLYNINHIDEFRDKINQYDSIIMINSYVMTLSDIKTEERKQKILNECYEFFKCYKEAKAFKIYQNHYGVEVHTTKTPYVVDYLMCSDKIMGQSLNDSFYKLAIATGIPYEKIQLSVDFSGNQTFEKDKIMTYIGRPASVKGYHHIPKFAKQLASKGIRIEMHGITRDMSSYQNIIKLDNVCYEGDFKNEKPDIFVWGPYKKQDVSKILSKTMFAFLPFKSTNGDVYGDRFEITQMEAIANKCILILHKQQGEGCRTKGNVRWIDIPYFAIWFDENDIDGFIKQVEKVVNDKELQRKYAETIYYYALDKFDMNNFASHIIDIMTPKEKHQCSINKHLLEVYEKYKFTEAINPLSLTSENIEKRIKNSFYKIEA